MGFIYKIINSVNEKIYIGQTKKSIQKRWVAHKQAIKRGKGCPLLARGFNAHGEDKFFIEMVEECVDELLNEREKYYIAHYNSLVPNGYNADAGGKSGGTFKGHTHTPETIAKWKETMKDKLESKEYRENISRGLKEYYAIPENREKHSARMKEVANNSVHSHKFKNKKTTKKVISEETKQKIRDSVNKYYETKIEDPDYMWSEVNKQKHSKTMTDKIGRKVGKYDDNGTLIESYTTIKEAAEKNNISRAAIWRYINDNKKGNQDYLWKYTETESKDAAQE